MIIITTIIIIIIIINPCCRCGHASKWALGDKGLFRFHRCAYTLITYPLALTLTFTFTFACPMSRVCALLTRARDACDAGPC